MLKKIYFPYFFALSDKKNRVKRCFKTKNRVRLVYPKVRLSYIYSIFMVYLSYIYSIFIVCLSYVVGKERVGS